MASSRSKRVVGLLVGLGVSALALALVLRRLSPAELGAALGAVSWGWLAPMAALRLTSMALRARRWRRTLGALQPRRYTYVFAAVGLGAAANIALPFKLGELLRVGLLKRHNPGVGTGDALATVAAERAVDGAILGLAALLALPFVAAPGWMWRGAGLLFAIMLTVAAAGALGPVHRWVSRRLPARGVLGLGRRVVLAFSRGTQVLRRPVDLAAITGWTALIWVCEASILWCAVRAAGHILAVPAALVVTLLYAVGLLVPSAPGQLGTHQALAVALLGPLGIAAAPAVSASIVLQATTVTVLGLIGAAVVLGESRLRALVAESGLADAGGGAREDGAAAAPEADPQGRRGVEPRP
ncbi:lysylphosphatidylglycerol synthase transmembrane domain-containing protein [Haliangium sp.]|uniref:lysylphosphatidylglycerol synthase transmembrane domain-containing protein n=1 Tax=Haliangium sp. TaxID=2663208 RepID=UPI003D151080